MAKRKMERQAFCTRLFVYARKRFLFSGGSCESVSIQAPSPTPSQKMSPLAKILCGVIHANISKTFPNILQKISKHSPKYLHPLSKNAVQEFHRIRKHFHGVNLANQKTWPIKQQLFFLYFHNFHACFLFL